MRGRDIFHKYRSVIYFLVSCASILPRSLRLYLFNLFNSKSGSSGLLVRYILVRALCKECGDNVSIHPYVIIKNTENLVLGRNVSIHSFSYIDCAGLVKIGSDVSIAHSSSILSSEHNYDDARIPIKDQGVSFEKTVISDNVWIGAGSRILAGSFIGSGSILAAGAVLNGSIPENSIFGGVPARFIKQRIGEE